MSIDRLCFGTSTFAAGRLRPDIDSTPGIAALRQALVAGVRLIHSNPGLGTQWAIREAVADAGHPEGVRHLVKLEIPLDVSEDQAKQAIRRSAELARTNLGIDQLSSVVIELDLKRTRSKPSLVDYEKITRCYQAAAEQVLKTGEAADVLAFCPNPAYLMASLRAESICGCAALYNLVAVTMSSPEHVTEILMAAENPLPASSVHIHARSWEAAASSAPARRSDHSPG